MARGIRGRSQIILAFVHQPGLPVRRMLVFSREDCVYSASGEYYLSRLLLRFASQPGRENHG